MESIKGSCWQSLSGADDRKPAALQHMEFTRTDFARLNLARALILNPEMLVMDMPVCAFDDEEAEEAMGLLKEHITLRGLAQDTSMFRLRRPRTVFISTALSRCNGADAVYCLDSGSPGQDGPLRLLRDVEKEDAFQF